NSTQANTESPRRSAGQRSNRQPSGSRPNATMLVQTHGRVRKQVTSTWLRLEADESGVHIRGRVVRLDTAAQWRALDGTRYETEASRFFFHSKIVWTIIPKDPKPPPRM